MLSMRFSLVPREMKFFDLFDETVAILSRAAGKFVDLVTRFDRLAERGQELKLEERACDEIVQRIITALDRTFITPFDREDIHSLATKLDDIMDNMEETAYRVVEFRIEKPTTEAVTMACIIQQCCDHIAESVRLCRDLKNVEIIQKHLQEITRLENDADNIYRDSDSALFANPPELLQFIKLRELYGWLEETVDACKDAALVITTIIVKGA
jgi:uncharacterized protein Yka (UPF0111/DUF47 family)